jgi:flavodoxin
MRVAIVYDSETGRTKAAALEMAEIVRAAGHDCSVEPAWEADAAAVSTADAICVGCWTQGLFIVAQHPTDRALLFIDRLGPFDGKPAAVFTTYRLAAGGVLHQLAARLEARGAAVTGQFKSRGPHAATGFDAWVRSLPRERQSNLPEAGSEAT